jgi:hypothetical protein
MSEPSLRVEDEGRLPRLRIDADGTWYADDVEVTHPGLLANLRANLRRDAQGYFIQARTRIPVEVADVPWVVVRVEPRGSSLHVWLNDATEEEVAPESLRLGPNGVPYCPVKAGAFEARFSRAATYQLLRRVGSDDETGTVWLELEDRRVPLRAGGAWSPSPPAAPGPRQSR